MTADGTVLSLTDDQRRYVMKASDVGDAAAEGVGLGLEAHRGGTECARSMVHRRLAESDWRHVRRRSGRRSWMDCPPGFAAMPAAPMWLARSWRRRRV
jgi:hypothetical protein